MNTSFCSFNVRGLGHKTKRDQIFHWLKQKSYSFCLLQESHLSAKDEPIWKQEWGGSCFFSGDSSSKAGVCILINPSVNCNVVKYTDIIPGRLQSLEVTINEKDFTIINLYGPNIDDATFFNDILTRLRY